MPNQVLIIEPQNELKFKGESYIAHQVEATALPHGNMTQRCMPRSQVELVLTNGVSISRYRRLVGVRFLH